MELLLQLQSVCCSYTCVMFRRCHINHELQKLTVSESENLVIIQNKTCSMMDGSNMISGKCFSGFVTQSFFAAKWSKVVTVSGTCWWARREKRNGSLLPLPGENSWSCSAVVEWKQRHWNCDTEEETTKSIRESLTSPKSAAESGPDHPVTQWQELRSCCWVVFFFSFYLLFL